MEDINLRGLAGSLKLGKSTNDNGFGMFRTMLEYKLTSQGKTYAKIDKWYPSSKTCSVCGFLTFSPRLKQGDSCINHHCTATEVVASYTMSDRRYFPCVPRYGMY